MIRHLQHLYRQFDALGGFLVLNLSLAVAVAWIVMSEWSLLLLVPLALVASLLEAAWWRRLLRSASQREGGAHRLVMALRHAEAPARNPIRDESTGLYHRWYLEQRLREEAARCLRYQHSMAVIVLRFSVDSIASFSVDDWQARSQAAAQSLVSVIRSVDLSASLAPFEFGVCLVHCDRAGALKALDRLLGSLDGFECQAGIVVYPEERHEPDAILEVAKARLRPWQPSPRAA